MPAATELLQTFVVIMVDLLGLNKVYWAAALVVVAIVGLQVEAAHASGSEQEQPHDPQQGASSTPAVDAKAGEFTLPIASGFQKLLRCSPADLGTSASPSTLTNCSLV